MICNICGNNNWAFVRRYNKPDKYERWLGIDNICRLWCKCRYCGFYKCFHNYDTKKLLSIYTDGYRSEKFRGESIKKVFNGIINLPYSKSENKHRVEWFSKAIGASFKERTILDIGAGLGVFLAELVTYPFNLWKPYAVEPNVDAARFIREELKIPCQCVFDGPTNSVLNWLADVVSYIHTLEHLADPELALRTTKSYFLYPQGYLFLEVPDAIEFDYLPEEHDEFNSCHLQFFTTETLTSLVESTGYKVTDIHRVRTKARDLSRIMLLAKAE